MVEDAGWVSLRAGLRSGRSHCDKPIPTSSWNSLPKAIAAVPICEQLQAFHPGIHTGRPSRASADAAKDAKVLKFSVLILGDTKYSPECIMAWKWKWSLG